MQLPQAASVVLTKFHSKVQEVIEPRGASQFITGCPNSPTALDATKRGVVSAAI